MEKIEELKKLYNQVITARENLIRLNNKYNEFLDKKDLLSDKETLTEEFIELNQFTKEFLDDHPQIINDFHNFIDYLNKDREKMIHNINEYNKKNGTNITLKESAIEGKYNLKKRKMLKVDIFILFIYLIISILTLNFGFVIAYVIAQTIYDIHYFKKLDKRMIQEIQDSKSLVNDENPNSFRNRKKERLFNEVCLAREYYHALENEYENILESLNTHEKKLFDEYLNYINEILETEKNNNDNTQVKKLVNNNN